MKKELNTIFKVVLFLVIVRHAIAMFTSIPYITYAIKGYISLGGIIWDIMMNVAMIAILLSILKIKRWALYAFGGLHFVNIIVISIFKGDLIAHILVALVMCAIMAGLLCLRNNGISGWKLFLASESELADKTENDLSAKETDAKSDDDKTE